jgi:hypothetical protein
MDSFLVRILHHIVVAPEGNQILQQNQRILVLALLLFQLLLSPLQLHIFDLLLSLKLE